MVTRAKSERPGLGRRAAAMEPVLLTYTAWIGVGDRIAPRDQANWLLSPRLCPCFWLCATFGLHGVHIWYEDRTSGCIVCYLTSYTPLVRLAFVRLLTSSTRP
ncbi:hypothetical protein BD777DRAFT_121508 [Yarrowia lipolytica]|nr:hypothetical protein BD777DRAFT_121508 [Yarrowia lipolytica]